MERSDMIRIYCLCIIVVIGLLDFGLNIASFIPVAGDAFKAASEAVLEVLQAISASIIFFTKFRAQATGKTGGTSSKMVRFCFYCAFIILSIFDWAGGGLINLIPGAGDVGKILIESMAELIQIAIAVALLL